MQNQRGGRTNIFTFIKEGLLNTDITDLKVSIFINKMLSRMFNKKEETITINKYTKIKIFSFSFVHSIFILIQQIYI